MLKGKQLLLLWFSALSIFYLDILSSEFFSFSPAECRRPVGLALAASHLWGDPSRSLSFSVPFGTISNCGLSSCCHSTRHGTGKYGALDPSMKAVGTISLQSLALE